MVKELEQRQRMKRAVYSWPSLVILATLTIFLVKGAASILSIERESASRVKTLESQSLTLISREEELKTEIERLDTPEGIIEEIKDKFSVTRAGEYMAIIVDERNKATTTEKKQEIWYKQFWNAIIKNK